MSSVNNSIPFVPENTIDPAAGLNEAINIIDALVQVLVHTVGANTPPAGVEGRRHIVGTAPTGAWAGKANKLARYLDGAWSFYDARYALNAADGLWYVRPAATWAVLPGGGGGMANPMTTAGDVIVGGAAGVPARIPIGAEGQVLVVRGGALVYEAQAGGTTPFAPVVADATTTRTLALDDAGNYLRFTSASAVVCTIPPQSSVTWAAYTEVHVRRAGAGNLTLTPGAGVTLNAPSGGTLTLTAGMSATLKRVAENEWDVIGQTVAV